MARSGFVDHVGIAVPDLAAAKEYYDDLMPILGLRRWFDTSPELNYGPGAGHGAQLFFYEAREAGPYSRHRTGLQHIGFMVATRDVVRAAHHWARERGDEILHAPREFPEYGEHCYATFWLDPHGFKLEAVCHTPENP